MLGVHKNFLDFEILETGNTKTLVFADSSQYMKPPDRPLLEIYLPGFNKNLLVNIVAGQINTFNSNTLGLGKSLDTTFLQDLPDGVYQFRYKICPYNLIFITKSRIRMTILINKLRSLMNQLDLAGDNCPEATDVQIQKQIIRVNILIQGADSAARKDDCTRASKFYQLADKMINDLSNKFCKNCN